MDTARILIVDDQIHALRGVSRIMKTAGYQTLEASNGIDCLRLAREHKPDLILLDVGLPDIDGMEVCKRIKSDTETANIYVVLLSSIHIESDSQAGSLEQGADGYIARPIPNRELVARVRAILRLKYAENRLREREERLRAVSESVNDAIIIINDKGDISFWNPASERIFGYNSLEVIGKNVHELLAPPEYQTGYRSAFKDFSVSGRGNALGKITELVARRNGGKEFPIELSLSSFQMDGRWHAAGIIRDISDRKRMEEERLEVERKLLHTLKLESLNMMAGGIAHDFNNQLAIVLGNLELALTERDINPEVRLSIINAIEAAKRSAELSRKIQNYTGNTLYWPVDLDLKELLTKNLSQLKSYISKNVTLNLDIYNTLPGIKGDADQIQRLVMNIRVNASEAIVDKDGEVTIRTGVMDCDAEYLSRSHPPETSRTRSVCFSGGC